MNSYIDASGFFSSSLTSVYTVLQSSNGRPISCSTEKVLTSWRKFIHSSTQPLEFESTITIIPSSSTTNEVLTIVEPSSLSDDHDTGAEAFFHFLDELESGAYAADDVTTEQ